SGTGGFSVSGDSLRPVDGRLEFASSVGPDQSVSVRGIGGGQVHTGGGFLQIDRPDQFLGSVSISYTPELSQGTPMVDLVGLAQADSYTYQKDLGLLSIFSGNSIIDTLHLTDNTPNSFVVQETAGSVFITAIGDPLNPPPGLPHPPSV